MRRPLVPAATCADIANEAWGVQFSAVNKKFMIALVAALLVSALEAGAQPANPLSEVGKEYALTKSYETSQQGSDGSSGSSSGRDVILERVTGSRDGGLELEYDLPQDAKAEERARNWQFPVRVFRPATGSMQVLNRSELETRVEDWLKAAGWPRSVCGRWIFTWNAFRIECDPQSVIEMLQAYDLRSATLREGAPYHDADASAPGVLVKNAAGPNGPTFVATMPVNPDAVRRARAESDVVVGEIMQQPVTLDAALRERAKEIVSGTITVTLDADPAGHVQRRTKVTKLETRLPGGRRESDTATERVERRLVSTRPADE
jgi:hypothetical protein